MNSINSKLSKVAKKYKTEVRDILILFENKIDKEIEYKIKKSMQKVNDKISIISKIDLEDSFSAKDSIFFEGFSLITQEFLSEQMAHKSFGMFLYKTKGLSNTQKTKFYYAFNGRRDMQGFVNSINAIKLSDNTILCPLKHIEETKDFFDFWNIEIKYVPIMIPQRLGKKSILSKVI